jgi:hypothetical protein
MRTKTKRTTGSSSTTGASRSMNGRPGLSSSIASFVPAWLVAWLRRLGDARVVSNWLTWWLCVFCMQLEVS